MKIRIVTNSGNTGLVDTDTGNLVFDADQPIEMPKEYVWLGYVHLPSEDIHNEEEIAAIREFHIRNAAHKIMIRSTIPFIKFDYITRSWLLGEKEADVQRLLDRSYVGEVDYNELDSVFTQNPVVRVFKTEAERQGVIEKIMAQPTKREYGKVLVNILYLGASWQKYHKNDSWIKEAEAMKGEKIYFANKFPRGSNQ